MRRTLSIVFFIGALLLLRQGAAAPAAAQGADPDPSTTYFVDVTTVSGLNDNRQGQDRAIGQAWGDVDRDGWEDLYLTDTDGPNSLYRNNGDGTFSLFSFADAVALADAYSGGAVFADYDNDGWLDLYVANWGPNVLFRNLAGKGFEDVTETAGVGDHRNGQTASWGDYDGDGFLDLYVANWACYPRCGRPMQGDRDTLYHNNGDGTFTDVSQLLGTRTVGAGFVANFVDYDNDGDSDIYLINDEFINPIGNVLWRNDGPGCDGWCFVDVAEEAGANQRLMGMGLATADYDRDGDLDFYFSNAGPMVLLQNQGDGTFADVADLTGVDNSEGIGWGTVFFDYNNDGWDDLYVAIMEGVKGRDASNALFRNNGYGKFVDVSLMSGAANMGTTLGVAYADYDRDGWVDLVVGNYDGQYHLYRNQTARHEENNWMAFNLVGGGPINRDAVGTRVYVSVGENTQLREVVAGSSLGAGNSLTLHFGLGDASMADEVRILWPDGTEQSFMDVAGGQFHTVTYGETASLPAGNTGPTPTYVLGVGALFLFLVLLIPFTARLRRGATADRRPRTAVGS